MVVVVVVREGEQAMELYIVLGYLDLNMSSMAVDPSPLQSRLGRVRGGEIVSRGQSMYVHTYVGTIRSTKVP